MEKHFLACFTWLQEHVLTTIQRPSCPLALPRIHHLPRVCILPPLEQLHATDQQFPRKSRKIQSGPNSWIWKDPSSGMDDAEGWHLFPINIPPVTACVVAIDTPSGFSTSLSPPFPPFEPWTHKAKIKLVTASRVFSCSQQKVPNPSFYCSSVDTGVWFPCRKAGYLTQGNVFPTSLQAWKGQIILSLREYSTVPLIFMRDLSPRDSGTWKTSSRSPVPKNKAVVVSPTFKQK